MYMQGANEKTDKSSRPEVRSNSLRRAVCASTILFKVKTCLLPLTRRMSKQVFTVKSTETPNQVVAGSPAQLYLFVFCWGLHTYGSNRTSSDPHCVGAAKVQTWQHDLFEWGLHVLALSRTDFLRL